MEKRRTQSSGKDGGLERGCWLIGEKREAEDSRAENTMNKSIGAGMSLVQRKEKKLGDRIGKGNEECQQEIPWI